MTSYPVGDWTVVVDRPANLPYNCVLLQQVHGATITTIDHFIVERPIADGVVTAGDVPVGILTADCLPLVLITPSRAIALHVSRASLVAGLLDQVPHILDPQTIEHVFIGPHICEQHLTYEHLGSALQDFATHFPKQLRQQDEQYHLSLREVVIAQLTAWKISPSVTIDERCTYEDLTLGSRKRWLAHRDGPVPHQITVVMRGTSLKPTDTL